MKYLVLIFALVLSVACGATQKPESFLTVGSTAPSFEVADRNGKMVSLAQLHKDGPVVITFLRSFF